MVAHSCQPRVAPRRAVLARWSSWMLFICLSMLGCTPTAGDLTPDVDRSSIDQVVRTLYIASDTGDMELLESVLDMRDEANSRAVMGFQQLHSEGMTFETTGIEYTIMDQYQGRARVTVRYHQKVSLGSRILADSRSGDDLYLEWKDDGWYIVGLGKALPPDWVRQPR